LRKKIKKLINSLNILKIHGSATNFDKSLWNIFDQYSSRTNNVKFKSLKKYRIQETLSQQGWKSKLKEGKEKKHEHGIIDVMDYLIKLSEFIIHYDD
jgi:hypothetical protein